MMAAAASSQHHHQNNNSNPNVSDDKGEKIVADRYLKKELLGEGTYGVVFKALDTKVFQLSPFLSSLF